MRIGRLIGATVLLTGFIILHGSIQNNALDLGLSWTISYISPYVLQFVCAVLLAYQISLLGSKKHFQRLILVGAILGLSGIAFAFNPIFEGDFSNDYSQVDDSFDANILDEGLTMVALPGCQYCVGRIPTLNKIKQRNSDLPINIIIIKEDSLTFDFYSEELAEGIAIGFTNSGETLMETVRGRFPAFLFKTNDSEIMLWSRNGLGTRAYDWMERRY